MAPPEALIHSDRLQQFEAGIEKAGERRSYITWSGRRREWELPGDDLVKIVENPLGAMWKVTCGDSGAATLKKAGVINFSNPDPDLVVLPKTGISKL